LVSGFSQAPSYEYFHMFVEAGITPVSDEAGALMHTHHPTQARVGDI